MFGSEAVKWTVEHSHEEWVLIMISSCKIPNHYVFTLIWQALLWHKLSLDSLVTCSANWLNVPTYMHSPLISVPLHQVRGRRNSLWKRIITLPTIPKERRLKCTFTAISSMLLVKWRQKRIIPSYFPVWLKWEGKFSGRALPDSNGVFCYKFMYLFTHVSQVFLGVS